MFNQQDILNLLGKPECRAVLEHALIIFNDDSLIRDFRREMVRMLDGMERKRIEAKLDTIEQRLTATRMTKDVPMDSEDVRFLLDIARMSLEPAK